jgi:hypothetical protein
MENRAGSEVEGTGETEAEAVEAEVEGAVEEESDSEFGWKVGG